MADSVFPGRDGVRWHKTSGTQGRGQEFAGVTYIRLIRAIRIECELPTQNVTESQKSSIFCFSIAIILWISQLMI
ncbi:MAG: hypothetical protein IJT30_02855, partial [Muribaculaceae bacterium]|nr:hypothetical protein [Muribaculaceae bacterium]